MHKQQRVFDGWLRNHQGLFFKIVRGHAFTSLDQEDLFQEIATQVWRSSPAFAAAQLSRPGFIEWH